MTVVSNTHVFASIAAEAHAAMRASIADTVSPKPDGEPGNVIRWDSSRRSFKSAMVTIVFVGMYLDARLYLALLKRFGKAEAVKADRAEHEKRFEKLGVTNSEFLKRVVEFRVARKDLVHEKAHDLSEFSVSNANIAQDVADTAIALMVDAGRHLDAT